MAQQGAIIPDGTTLTDVLTIDLYAPFDRSTMVFLFLLGISSSVTSCSAQSQQTSVYRVDTFTKIEGLAGEGIKKHNFPSIAIGIVLDGEIIYAKGIGYADREKRTLANENTVYQIGSVTKTFTGNILAQLLVEKKLTLDEPLYRLFHQR